MLFNLAFGMIAGLDIFQGVLVLRTKEVTETFCRHNRLSAGGTVGASFGPLGAGMGLDVLPPGLYDLSGGFSVLYAKSRGLFLGAHLDGKVAVTQQAANEAFYGQKGITAREILAGNVPLSGSEGMWYVQA